MTPSSLTGPGCDVMGFYSVFSSLSGMTSTLWVSVLTLRVARGRDQLSARASMVAGAAVIGGSALVAALPFMGVGQFAYTGEGFCYFDWHHKGLATVMLAITVPTIIGTVTLLGLADRAGKWPSRLDLLVMLFAFLSAWMLWVPASIIGLAGKPFPQHYMIAGGVMGHAQALINPYVYGIRWRRSALSLSDKLTKESNAVMPEPAATPVTSAAVDVPSAPPSPPQVESV